MRPLLLVTLLVWVAVAATPVASVTSSSNFQLSGANVVVAGVPSWPLMAGDTVVAGTGAARIRFVDGSVVNLGPRSKVSVEQKKDDLSVHLVDGFVSFVLAPSSGLRIYSGNTLVPAQPGVTVTASTGAATTNLIVIGPPPGGPPSLSQH
jgi:ferric-dicitrate binding protein FerR (iron transport regulator)